MYAVVETGGKQYRVEAGQTLDVERLPVEIGETVELGRVLMVSDEEGVHLGDPVVEGARVVASVVDHGRGKKIIVFRYRPKTRYRKKTGHRQDFTRVSVERILLGPEQAVEEEPVEGVAEGGATEETSGQVMASAAVEAAAAEATSAETSAPEATAGGTPVEPVAEVEASSHALAAEEEASTPEESESEDR